MKIIKFLLLTVVTLLVGCTTQTGRHETIERAKQLMNEYPDSALALLDSLLPYQGAFSKSMRMDFMLQRLNALNKCDTIFHSDSIAKIFVDYYSNHGTSNQRMLANYLAGRVYYDIGELPRALQFYQDAAEAADTTRADCDLYSLYAIYGQMAQLFHAQFLPDDEMTALRTAEQCAWNGNDTISALAAYELRVRPYYLKNEKDSVLFILNHVRDLYLQYGYRENAARVLSPKISILIDQNKYAEVHELMQIYESESGLFKADGNIMPGREMYYYEKGRYALFENKTDSAVLYFTKLLNAKRFEAGYKGLMQVYEKRNKPDSVAKYATLYAAANDSSYLHVNQNSIHQISAMYDYSRHQKMAEKERIKAERSKRERFALWTALIGMIVIAVWLYIWQKRKNKRKILHLLNAYEANQIALSHAKNEIRLMAVDYETNKKGYEEKCTNLMAQIERGKDEKGELASRIDDLESDLQQARFEADELKNQFDADMLKKSKEIEDLLRETEIMNEKLMTIDATKMEEDFKKDEVYLLFHDKCLSLQINHAPTEMEWRRLLNAFRKSFVRYHSFVYIKHRLSENQYRLCVLIRLGFNNKQMEFLLKKDADKLYRLKRTANLKIFGKDEATTLIKNLTPYY